MRHFHEKLREQHGIELSYSWVKQALQGSGLVARERQRGVKYSPKQRKVGDRAVPEQEIDFDANRVLQDDTHKKVHIAVIRHQSMQKRDGPRAEHRSKIGTLFA